MIRLSRKTYKLPNITENDFWVALDDITVGQNLNPELSYSPPFLAKSKNVFGGRKVKNNFSLFLYRPFTRELWMKILAKGKVSFDSKKDCVVVNCRFEIPFWSLFLLLLFGLFFIVPSYIISLKIGIIINTIFLLICILVLKSNYRHLVNELKKQFSKISEVELANTRTL